MACRYTYNGKTYDEAGFVGVLRAMPPAQAAKYISGVEAMPDAPFAGNTEAWAGLAMKRALRWAAENGFDQVAWTTGDQQAERYDLSKQVESIEALRNNDGTYSILAVPIDGGRAVSIGRSITEANLPDHVGKEIAEKIAKQPAGEQTYSGLDLKVGGDGMRGFYDKILPAFVSKYVKKWGARVRGTSLSIPDRAQANIDQDHPPMELIDVHAVDITPAMRDSVKQGQPLFALRRVAAAPIPGLTAPVAGTRVRGTAVQEKAINKAVAPIEKKSLRDKVVEVYETLKETLADEFTWAAADEFHGLRKMGRHLMPKSADRELGSWVAARLTRHSAGQIEAFLKYGAPKWNPDDVVLGIAPDTEGLFNIVAPLYQQGLERLFDGYAYARRVDTQGLIAEGREKNMTPAEVEASLRLGEEHPILVEVFDKVQAYKKAVLDAVEDMGLINAEQRATWEKADHVPFYRLVEDKESGPVKKRGLAGQSPQIRRLTGGEETFVVVNAAGDVLSRHDTRAEAAAAAAGTPGLTVESAGQPIVGVVENVAKNISHLIDAAMKNHASIMAIDEALEAGWAEKVGMDVTRALVPMEAMAKVLQANGIAVDEGAEGIAAVTAIQPPVKPGNDVISVRRDGKIEYYRIDDRFVYRALAGMYRAQMSWFTKPIAALKRGFTRTITAMPGFMARNFARDTMSAWLISEDRSLNFFGEMVESIKALGTRLDDPKVRAMMAAGGDTGWYQNAPEDVVEQLREMEKTGTAAVLAWANPRHLFKMWERVGRASELANRAVVYDATVRATGSVRQAAFEAMDLMDFQAKGGSDFMIFMTGITPFLNARIQGLYKLGRMATTDSTRARKSFAAKAAMMISFSVLLAMMNAGDDDEDGYNDLPEWVKDGSWAVNNYRIFGKENAEAAGLPRFFLIPKPFELGALFGTVPERMVQLIAGNDRSKDTWDALVRVVTDTFAMNPIGNPLFKETIEQWANKDFFRDAPIVSQSLEALPPEQQAAPGTTETAKRIGEATGISPLRIEHAVRGFTGTLGTYLMAIGDSVQRALGIAPEKPSLRPDEMEVIRSFLTQDPARSTKWMERFYELRAEAVSITRGTNALIKDRQIDDARELVRENAPLLANRKEIEATADLLSTLRKADEAIRESENLSPDEKRQALDRLLTIRNRVAKRQTQKFEAAVDD